MAASDRVDARGQTVTCKDCGREYVCTPDEDYYEATTLTDGMCWDCFLADVSMPPQKEPPYRKPLSGTQADM